MNFLNKILLGLVLLPKKIYASLDIDNIQLRSILTYKLIMDDRKPNVLGQAKWRTQKGNKETRNATIRTTIVSLLLGAIFLYVFKIGEDPITQFTFYFSILIMLISMTLISDFTSVLIDIRDNYIILPKPINDRTFLLSRILHILIHIFRTVVPMTLPGFLFIIYYKGVYPSGVFLILVGLTTLFCIFLINAIYILILKITTPERFKNIINYFQIFFAIFIYAAFQIFPRLINTLHLNEFQLIIKPWYLFLPPYWFASAFKIATTFHGSFFENMGLMLSVLIPITSIYIVNKFLAPAFNQNLSMIAGSEGMALNRKNQTSFKKVSKDLGEKLSHIFIKNPMEMVGFQFVWKMISRNRDFKIKVYPSLGYIIVIIVMMFIRNTGFMEKDYGEHSGNLFPLIMVMYISSLFIIVALRQMNYSDQFKAGWVFLITPIDNPGYLISGGIKAILFQFFTLISLIFLIIGVFVGGPIFIPNILLVISNQMVVIYIMSSFQNKDIPFSQPQTMAQVSGQFLKSMIRLIAFVIIGGIHFLIYKYNLAVSIAILISLFVLYFLMENIKKISWEQVATNPI